MYIIYSKYIFSTNTPLNQKNYGVSMNLKIFASKKINLENTTNSIKCTSQMLTSIVKLGNCFGLLPVTIRKSNDHYIYEFRWFSFKVFYTLVTFLLITILNIMVIYHMRQDSILGVTSIAGIHFNAVLTIIVFFVLAKSWPQLMSNWCTTDRKMELAYGFPEHLNKKLMYIAICFLLLAAVEHFLFVFDTVYVYNEHTTQYTITEYYQKRYPHVFNYIPFSAISAVLLQVLVIEISFIWNYSNLFVIVMSITLAERFKQFTAKLKQYKYITKFSSNYWTTIREDYERLSNLCSTLDENLAYIILLSYTANFVFLLIQLYNSILTRYESFEKLYFLYSFGFLIFRYVIVSLYAAQVNEASKEPARILHSVPSAIYNHEIKRILHQIKLSDVTFTGSRIFRITRGIILHIAGTLVTYEIVLIQLSNYGD